MKTSNRIPFKQPTVVRAGSLTAVTAIISDPAFESDVRLKKDIESFESVLPRIKELK